MGLDKILSDTIPALIHESKLCERQSVSLFCGQMKPI